MGWWGGFGVLKHEVSSPQNGVLLVNLDFAPIWRHSDAMSFAPKHPKTGVVYLSKDFNFDVRVIVCIFKTIWGAGGVPKNA